SARAPADRSRSPGCRRAPPPTASGRYGGTPGARPLHPPSSLPRLADLEPREAFDDDALPRLGVHAVDEIPDPRLARRVPDEGLLEQALLAEEFLELALDNLVDDLWGLLLVRELGPVDLALPLDDRRGNVLARDVGGVRRGDLHREVFDERLERVGFRDEVRLAVDLDEHAELGAGVVDVGADDALLRLPMGPPRRLGEPSLPEVLDRSLQVPPLLLEGLLAVHHPRPRPVAELLHELGARRPR